MSGLANKIVRFLRREILRDPVLLEAKRWFRDDGESRLRYEYPLDEHSVVWDLGGYHGDFAARIQQKFGCRVSVFEPVPAFYARCVERFAGNDKIRCLMYGLSREAGVFAISDSADASSFVRPESGVIARQSAQQAALLAELRPVTAMFDELGVDQVDLLKINIEGGEYDVLPALIDAGLMVRVRFLQIQFHDFIPGAEAKRDAIRAALAQTHTELWRYRFVWECWAPRTDSQPGTHPDDRGRNVVDEHE